MGINNKFYQMVRFFIRSKVSVTYRDKRAARTQPGKISVFNLPYKVLNPSR